MKYRILLHKRGKPNVSALCSSIPIYGHHGRNRALFRHDGKQGGFMKTLNCNGSRNCPNPVTHLGDKGWVYCNECHFSRRGWEHTRKLRKWEIRILEQGVPLISYMPLSRVEYAKLAVEFYREVNKP